jgi:hypothetical protein
MESQKIPSAELLAKRDRLMDKVRGIAGVESVGIGVRRSLVVLLKYSGAEELLPQEFEGCEVTSLVVGEAICH